MPSTPAASDPVEGAAAFFNGLSSLRQSVRVTAGDHLAIHANGQVLADWPWDRVRLVRRDQAEGLVLTLEGGEPLARLHVAEPVLVDAISVRTEGFHKHRSSERRMNWKIAGWSAAAVVSLVLVGVFGMPMLADAAARALPWSVDRQLGQAFDGTIRTWLVEGTRRDDCGSRPDEAAGRAALGSIVARVEPAADLPFPLKVVVLPGSTVNAFATAGGHIYLLEGLIAQARSAEEVAGVLAHEVGHVVARDGTRRLVQSTGVSFLFGMILGDFTGGGALVLGARALTESAYSREAETRADQFAIETLLRQAISPDGLAGFLRRASNQERPGLNIGVLDSHPVTEDRLKRIESAGQPAANRPILSEDEWKALKRICGGKP
jgi:Zn-dependent protease with chaperone function